MMKRFVSMLLAVMLCVLPLAAQAGSPIDGWAAKVNAAKAAKIATNEGLTVKSPEQFLGIDPCDRIVQEGNSYYYKYTNRGYEWYGYGTDDPVDWYKMEDYVDALVASGYYKVLEHPERRNEELYKDEDFWSLQYIGPKSVTKTFGAFNNTSQKAAIVVMSYLGDIWVKFSVDITTDDLDETQKRLGTNIFVNKPNDNNNSRGEWCTACGNSGKCSGCGGNKKVKKHVAGTTEWIYQDCLDCFGSGKCKRCDGDGWR